MQIVEKERISKSSTLKYKKKLRPGEVRKAWISRILLWVMMAIVLFPVLAIVSASMAKGNAFTQSTIFPTSWTLENYKKVITNTNFLIWVKNSLIVCFATAIMQLAMTIPASFAFSKLKFKGRRKGLMFLLLLQMFPTTMALPAILGIAYKLNGMDKIITLIIIGCGGSAYNIWLLKGFLDGIPKELSEAAFVDGATTFQTFVKIILPLTKNMLVVIFLFSFISSYGEYIFASALLKNPDSQTLMVGLRSFINNKFSANWPQYSAAAVMASAPIVVLFLMSQKFISKGLVSGAVKG